MNIRFFVLLTAVVAILVCNSTCVISSSSKMVDEILKMHESGLSEETILMYLESRDAEFDLTSDDLIMLRKAGFSEEFIQALLQFRKAPDSYVQPQMNYGSSYSLGFNYGCFSFDVNQLACNPLPCEVWGQFGQPGNQSSIDQKRYFYSGGHAYVRHNGHFHKDDEHRFQGVMNLNQLPENAFISYFAAKNSLRHAAFTPVQANNRWSTKPANSGRSKWGNTVNGKNNQPAGSFRGRRSGRSVKKIGFGAPKGNRNSSSHK